MFTIMQQNKRRRTKTSASYGEDGAARVPAGGPATINGVVYQMLWSLLRATQLRIEGCRQDKNEDVIVEACLVLEPGGGGGDLRLATPDGTVVEQVKARPNGGPWSLREIITSVLPDLFLAVDLSYRKAQYRFVTEGRLGDWQHVYEFFQSLRTRACPGHGILTALDDTKELAFRHKRTKPQDSSKAFWADIRYTERSLFELMVETLMATERIAKANSIDLVRRKLWHLLGRFEFAGGQTAERLQKSVDGWLLERIDCAEQLPEKRDAMLIDLARQASRGDARINRQAFLGEHLLDSTSLKDWNTLLHDGAERLKEDFARRGYDATEDVRAENYAHLFSDWLPDKPILLVSGESGQGKSWCLFGIGECISRGHELAVLAIAKGDEDATLQKAANIFWQDIKHNEAQLSLGSIAKRRHKVVQTYADRWLTILIDGVQEFSEARALAVQPWEEWGIRVAIACAQPVAKVIEAEARGRAVVRSLDDFTEEQLQTYLSRRLGEHWPDVPRDVRSTLRRPLLASLYCRVAFDKAWQPTNEYELYAACWGRLGEEGQSGFPRDAVCLERAAFSLLGGSSYPWSAGQLEQAGFSNDAITRLCGVGWLRRTQDNHFEVWHDRLLNWAVAQGLVAAMERRDLCREQLCEHVQALYDGISTGSGRFLGYVPMDVVWLLTRRVLIDGTQLDALLAALEATKWPKPELLHTTLLPTVGPDIVSAQFRRLVALAGTDDTVLLGHVVEGITAVQTEEVSKRALSLLDDDSPYVQRVGMKVLGQRPTAAALDRLWQLHCEIEKSPERFLRKHDSPHGAYRDSFQALRACVRLSPDWLERAIGQACSDTEPVETLGWLVVNLSSDDGLWHRCKRSLFEKIPLGKERCLAANINVHRDESELDWLLSHVDREDNLIGPVALQALARIAPDVAVDQLRRLPRQTLAGTRRWCFADLLARRPQATRACLLEILRSESDPWPIAMTYQDSEDAMDAPTLDFLLSSLELLLDQALSAPSDGGFTSLYVPLRMLAKISGIGLLECFARRRGTSLEEKLTKWLLSLGPRRSAAPDHLEREPGIGVLHKIGGDGFTRVVNSLLRADNYFGRTEGILQAAKRGNAETVQLLVDITRCSGLRNEHPIEQQLATEALVALGRWEHVVESIVQWGLKTSQSVTVQRPACGILRDAELRPALELIANGAPTPGAVLAVSVSGRSEFVDIVHAVADTAAADSELMLACVSALNHLEDASERTAQLFSRQLHVPEHCRMAAIGLLHLGSRSALATLSRKLEDRYDEFIAVNLALRQEFQQVVARSLWAERQRSRHNVMADVCFDFLGCLPDREVREFLQAAAFDSDRASIFVGTRTRAIRGLAQFDPERAFLAAQKALQDTSGRDRIEYPYLLMELDAEKGAAVLLSQLPEEADPAAFAAAGRALDNADVGTTLDEWFAAEDESLRVAACRLAGWRRVDDAVTAMVERCLDDVSEDVVKAAHEAWARIGRSQEVQRIVLAFREGVDESRQWMLIDALLAIGDPGDKNQAWPWWAREVAECVPSFVRVYLKQEIRKRKDEVAKQLRSAKPW